MRLHQELEFFENRRNCQPSELHGGSLFRAFKYLFIQFQWRVTQTPYRLLSASNSQPKLRQAVSGNFGKFTSCDIIAFISSLIEVIFCSFRCAY